MMDKLQPTFKDKYVSKLKYEVTNEIALDKYNASEFEYDNSMVCRLSNINQPNGLLEKMMQAKDECTAAIYLFEAYKNISPLLASTEQFWVYLCHVDLFPYMQKRWNGRKEKNYVLDHWFIGNHGYIRNGLASLWWSVHCSYDQEREDPYELTRILFKNYSLRTTWLKVILRSKEALLGILEFLKENPEIMKNNLETRGEIICRYVNLLGGTKQLSNLRREYIVNELNKIKTSILNIKIRTDAQNKDLSDILK